ncbi:MAG: alpha-isopropylmalate synthase regulatory domain-containing protein, partial [Deltaproteobacteria bacterium]|nr:alpha-isopropylmalate synthase regulatory domain-containing protein [Deltaproteobacteria bacterium]
IKEKSTYEIMTPQSVGISGTHLVLGKHSGRHAIVERLKKLGYILSKEEVGRVFVRFKELADVKKEIFDEDLEAIISEEIFRIEDKYKLVSLTVMSGNVSIPTATMEMEIDKEIIHDAGFGIGPVDATFAAIKKITNTNDFLQQYVVNAITGGADAQGEVAVHLRYGAHIVVGRGAHPDILVASAKAYINALNRLERLKTEAGKVKV